MSEDLTDYEKLEAAVRDLPMTYVPGILAALIERGLMVGVFKDKDPVPFVQKVTDRLKSALPGTAPASTPIETVKVARPTPDHPFDPTHVIIETFRAPDQGLNENSRGFRVSHRFGPTSETSTSLPTLEQNKRRALHYFTLKTANWLSTLTEEGRGFLTAAEPPSVVWRSETFKGVPRAYGSCPWCDAWDRHLNDAQAGIWACRTCSNKYTLQPKEQRQP
jgi:hypothetical protein